MPSSTPTPARGRRPALALLAAALLALLAACGAPLVGEAPAGDQDFAYTQLVEIDGASSRADVARLHDAEVLVWRPEAGFAVLGLHDAGGLGSQASKKKAGVEANRGAIAAPTAEAAGVWNDGFHTWSGGFQTWSGGFQTWSGGFQTWSGGERTFTPMDNLDVWLQLNLPDAHGGLAPRLGAGTVVAVVDTGVDLTHPAVQGRLVPGWDFVDHDAVPQDEPGGAGYGHGTGVAGLILQVAPEASIMPLRVLDPNGYGDTDDVAEAIDWAVANGADVINLSLGAAESSKVLKAMTEYAARKGVYVVASTGNSGRNHATYPAADFDYKGGTATHLLGVGSVNSHDVKSAFSNYGVGLGLLAPGEALFTAAPESRVGYWTGTSFATPLTSGALALALAEKPLDPSKLAELVKHVSVAGELVKNLPENKQYQKELSERLDLAEFLRKLGVADHADPFTFVGGDLDLKDPTSEREITVKIYPGDHAANLEHVRLDSIALHGDAAGATPIAPHEVKLESDRIEVKFRGTAQQFRDLLAAPTEGFTDVFRVHFALADAAPQPHPVTVELKAAVSEWEYR